MVDDAVHSPDNENVMLNLGNVPAEDGVWCAIVNSGGAVTVQAAENRSTGY